VGQHQHWHVKQGSMPLGVEALDRHTHVQAFHTQQQAALVDVSVLLLHMP
jgi:hypothetical protein